MADRDRETSLWNWLKTGLKTLGLRNHVRRVENSVSTGDPDVEGCIDGVTFNVELKVATPRAKGRWRLDHYTSKQAYFAHERHRAGGISCVLVRTGQGSAVRHYLVPGSLALDLYEARKDIDPADLERWSLCPPDSSCHHLWKTVILRS